MWQDRWYVSPMQFCAQDLLASEIALNSPSLPSAERSVVAADALRSSGRLRLQVHGESMLPTIWPGAIVEIASCSIEDVHPGEIVLALRDGRFFLHRFFRREPSGFLLRGDSMPVTDPSFPDDALLGRLVSRGQVSKYSSFLLCILCPAIGRLLCYCGPVRRVALHLHRRRGERRHEIEGLREACPGRPIDLEA
jgi:Peptidase S24-like